MRPLSARRWRSRKKRNTKTGHFIDLSDWYAEKWYPFLGEAGYLDTCGPLQASDLGTHMLEEDGVTAGRVALVVGAGDFLGSAIAAACERFPERFAERPADGFMQPDELAEIYWQLHAQPRSAWSFETDVRTYVESW